MISVLDKSTIDKIAAGEVIERPASIVKELLENSIDANSTQIVVEIKDGGTSLIRVSDNGSGIKKDEVKKAFLRHATSKIKEVKDLDNLRSLGFRGEALSSISAVSKTSIITKTKDDFLGVFYKIEGSLEKEFEEVASVDGTTIIIEDLFFNIPVRKKFLKSIQTETANISDIVEKLALANPHISFRYISNNVNKLHTLGNLNIKDILFQIYGKDLIKSLLPVDEQDDEIKISGYISKPDYFKSTRAMELYFINSRYIRNSIIKKAIEDAYSNRLMQNKYPFVILNIEIEPKKVDVNVHPSKMEIKFDNPNIVYASIKSKIEKVLLSSELIKEVELKNTDKEKNSFFEALIKEKERIPEVFETKRLREYEDSLVKEREDFYQKNQLDLEEKQVFKKVTKEEIDKTEVKNTDKTEEVALKKEEQLKFLDEDSVFRHKIIGQVFSTYIIIEFNTDMYLIDQHAAHEKIIYEKLYKFYLEYKVEKQYVSPAIIVSLSELEIASIENNREIFERLGFEIEHFGSREYRINAVPNNFMSINKKEMFLEFLASISEDKTEFKVEKVLEKLASLSCKAAIKAGKKLSDFEINSLIRDMINSKNPYNCPHGRPVIIKISKYEIEKMFKRIV